MRHHHRYPRAYEAERHAPERCQIWAMQGGRERHGGRRFGRHGHGGHEGLEGRGRRRMFEGGELRLVMLLLMEREPRHGYDIIREIESRTGGAYAPSPGIVYPTLTLLEEIGQVEARALEGTKRLYGITPMGLEHLEANRAAAKAALERLEALAHKDAAIDTGPVYRAMSNLKAVLRQRLTGSPEMAVVFAVADAIDETARKIERL